jgi:hypothetical protein
VQHAALHLGFAAATHAAPHFPPSTRSVCNDRTTGLDFSGTNGYHNLLDCCPMLAGMTLASFNEELFVYFLIPRQGKQARLHAR